MNNLFKKIGILFTGLAMAVGVGVAIGGHSAYQEAFATTYNFSSIPTAGSNWSTSGKSVTINSISWTYSSCTYIGVNSSKIQVGSGSKPQTTAWTIQTAISNFGANKRVTAVGITANTTAVTATYDISVGGSSVKSGSLTTSSATYSESNLNVDSGDIVVTLTGSSTSKAIYLNNISVTYEDKPAASYNVTLSSGDGTGEDVSGGTTSGTLSAPACPASFEAPSGKVFKGWTISGGTSTVYKTGQSISNISANITLVAAWDTPLTVTYDANGGSGTMTDSNTYFSGDSVTILDNAFTAPSNKIFAGWKIEDDDVSGSFTITANTTLVAQWVDKVTLSFNSNGGTGTMNPVEYATGATAVVPANGFTAPTDNEFVGWKDGSGNTKSTSFTITEDTTLYAQWAPKKGTLTYPYTIDELIENQVAIYNSQDIVYAKGFVTEDTTEYDSQAFDIYISDDGETTSEFDVYNINYVGNISMTSELYDSITIGDELLVCGRLKKYGDEYYFSNTAAGYIYSHVQQEVEFVFDGEPNGSLKAGDAFELGTTVSVAYLLASFDDIDNLAETDSKLTYKIDDTPIEIGDAVPTNLLGERIVTVTFDDGYGHTYKDVYDLTVTPKALAGISITTKKTEMLRVDEFTFGVTASPNGADPSVEWTVDNKEGSSIPTDDFDIDADSGYFYINTKTSGTLVVTATSTVDGTKSDFVEVSVNATATVTINNSAVSNIYTGNSGSLSYVSSVNLFDSLTYSWTVTSGSAVSINGASNASSVNLNYVEEGNATVRLTVTDASNVSASAECTFAVTASSASSVVISGSSDPLVVGKTRTLTAAVSGTGHIEQSVTWHSDNESVATVSSSGVVTALKPGKANITASSVSPAGKTSDNFAVRVVRSVTEEGVVSGSYSLSNLTGSTSKAVTSDELSAVYSNAGGLSEPTVSDITNSFNGNQSGGDVTGSGFLRIGAKNGGTGSITFSFDSDISRVDFTARSWTSTEAGHVTANDSDEVETESGSYHNYSITLDDPSDEVVFACSSRAYFTSITFYSSSVVDVSLSDEALAVDAFIQRYMHMDYDANGKKGEQGEGTGLCETYYPLARNAFNGTSGEDMLNASARAFFLEHNEYAKEVERLGEWARINHEQFDEDSESGTYQEIISAKGGFVSVTEASNENMITYVVIASSLFASFLAFGAYFVFKKRKEDR